MTQTPKQHHIIPPDGGWKAHTYYQVEVKWESNNPVHYALLAVGFLSGGGIVVIPADQISNPTHSMVLK